MKTIYEYEASDIKLDGFAEGEKMDPVHSFLLVQMMRIGLTGFKPGPDDPPGDATLPIRRNIAEFLNAAQKAGITIAPGEAVPAAFRAEVDK